MLQDLMTAFALLLIIEGVGPGLAPGIWQRYIRQIGELNPKVIRMTGIISMLAGAVLLQFLR